MKRQDSNTSGNKKKRLQDHGETVILFEDEFSLSNTATVSYDWSVKGKQPRVMCKQRKRERQTVFGTVNPDSGQSLFCR
jgi:hypothetical protein